MGKLGTKEGSTLGTFSVHYPTTQQLLWASWWLIFVPRESLNVFQMFFFRGVFHTITWWIASESGNSSSSLFNSFYADTLSSSHEISAANLITDDRRRSSHKHARNSVVPRRVEEISSGTRSDDCRQRAHQRKLFSDNARVFSYQKSLENKKMFIHNSSVSFLFTLLFCVRLITLAEWFSLSRTRLINVRWENEMSMKIGADNLRSERQWGDFELFSKAISSPLIDAIKRWWSQSGRYANERDFFCEKLEN